MRNLLKDRAQPGRADARALSFRLASAAVLVLSMASQPALAASVPPAPTATVLNQPPVQPVPGVTLSVFPSRDFVTTTGGYPAGDYTVNVIRNGVTIGSARISNPDLGVNHPGGSCWDVQTPDIHPGDQIRITDKNGVANQTTVQDVSAQAATTDAQGNLVVHGTAAAPTGAPLPVDQLESRILSPKGILYSASAGGKRDIRAGVGAKQGTLSYDPIDPVSNPKGINWTAVYKVQANGGPLLPSDVALATDPVAQPVVIWLGSNPASLAESTNWELPGAGRGIVKGPQAPCTAPAQTGPTVGLSVAPGAYKTPQSVVITASDPAALINVSTDGSTPASTGGVPGPITKSITATTTLKALANNAATGELSAIVGGTYLIDTVAPTANLVLSGTQGAPGVYRSAVTATVTAADTGGSGLASLRYSLDGGPLTDVASGASILVSGDGKHTLSATATDLAGNASAPATQTFTIDTVAPTASFTVSGMGAQGKARGPVTVSMSGLDNAGGSGLVGFFYVLDGAPPAASTDGILHVSTPGSHTLVVFGVDAAGNTSTPQAATFLIDTTAPVASITLGGSPTHGIYPGAVTATLSATDEAGGSGLALLQYTLDGGTPTTIASGSTLQVSGDGAHTLTATATDQAGNTSAPLSQALVIDSTPPTLSATPAGGSFADPQTVVLSANDASAVAIYYTLDGSVPSEASTPVTGPVLIGQSATLSSVAIDATGNRSAVRTDVYSIGAQPAPAPTNSSSDNAPQTASAPSNTSSAASNGTNGSSNSGHSGGGSSGGGGGGGRSSGAGSASASAGGGFASSSGAGAAAGPSFGPAAAAAPVAAPAAPAVAAPASEPLAPAPASDPLAPASAGGDPLAVASAPAPAAAEPVLLVVDPTVGGTLSANDGAISVTVPAEAASDTLVLSLTHVVDQTQQSPNLQLGSQRFLLGALDSVRNTVLTFNQPLVITIRPTADDLAAANGDLSAMAIMVLNGDTGAFEALPTTVNADGTLSISLDHLAQPLPAATVAADAPALTGEESVAVEDVSAVSGDPLRAGQGEVASDVDLSALQQDVDTSALAHDIDASALQQDEVVVE